MPILATDRLQDGATEVWFLHGILGSRRNWRGFVRQLAARRPDLGLRTVDLRCHGDSHGFAAPHTIGACIDDLRALAGGRRPAAVVGHSFGGKVAMAWAMAADAPRQIWALDSVPGGVGEATAAAASDDVWQVIDGLERVPMPQPDRERVDAAMRAAKLGPAIRAWMTTNLQRAEDGLHWRFDLPAVRALLQSYGQIDTWSSLEGGSASETVFVRAGKGGRWQPAEIDRLERAAALGHLRLHTLPEAGHWLHVDAPEALTTLLADGLLRAEVR
ncbi:MAG: hypothetical protein RIT45_1020 [Pseudomonadota bacterium]